MYFGVWGLKTPVSAIWRISTLVLENSQDKMMILYCTLNTCTVVLCCTCTHPGVHVCFSSSLLSQKRRVHVPVLHVHCCLVSSMARLEGVLRFTYQVISQMCCTLHHISLPVPSVSSTFAFAHAIFPTLNW